MSPGESELLRISFRIERGEPPRHANQAGKTGPTANESQFSGSAREIIPCSSGQPLYQKLLSDRFYTQAWSRPRAGARACRLIPRHRRFANGGLRTEGRLDVIF